jgi:hypothetical protein
VSYVGWDGWAVVERHERRVGVELQELDPPLVALALQTEMWSDPRAETCAARGCRHLVSQHHGGVCMVSGCDCPGLER